MAKVRLTDEWVKKAQPVEGRPVIHYDLPADSGKGDFVRGFALQVTPSGTKTFLLCYVAKATGHERRMVVGTFPTTSLSAARRIAREHRALVEVGRDPWLEEKESRAQADAARLRRGHTVADLLGAYVEHMKAGGRVSWRAVETAFDRHVLKPFPRLAKTAADKATLDDFMGVFRDLAKEDHHNEARKLRAYLRAAFNAACAARHDAGIVGFDGFDLHANPLAMLRVTRPQESAEKAAAVAKERKWSLSEGELAAYWRRTFDLAPAHGALARLHLLTGGQRVRQLGRVTVADYDSNPKGQRITIRDIKGRRRVAYEHVVPLIPDAVAAIEQLRGNDPRGEYVFTVTRGATPASENTLSESIRAIGDAMVAAGECARRPTPGTIRKTVETRLMELGVPREVRAHLLSHGRGDVQAVHYEATDLEVLKRDALRKLRRLCEPKGKPGNVTPLRRKA